MPSSVKIRSANRFFALGDLTRIPKFAGITPNSLAKENKLLIAPTATRFELSELDSVITHIWTSDRVQSEYGLLSICRLNRSA